MDVLLALPAILLAVLLVAALGAGVGNLIVAISISQIPYVARFVRHLAAREARRDYVRSARALGIRSWRIMLGEILPNIAGPLLVQATAILAVSAGFESGLSFIGVGLPPSVPDWGYMVKNEEQFIYAYPMLTLVPALLITMFVLAVNLIGDDLRDAVDPRKLR
jgi:peptide/nickel transport system permease protein